MGEPRSGLCFVSGHGFSRAARSAQSWVESRMGAGTGASRRRPVSHPRSSNRTCGFAASGFPTGFIADSRARSHHEASRRPGNHCSSPTDTAGAGFRYLRHTPIHFTVVLCQHTRSKGPSLHRHYPASPVHLTLSDAQMVRVPFRTRLQDATLRPSRASPTDADCLLGVLCPLPRWPDPCRWLSLWRAPAPGSSGSARPSPLKRRVGFHITAFEACSSFTRVTARQVARPPFVDFVARFQPGQFPSRTARQLSNLTINCSSGSFPHW